MSIITNNIHMYIYLHTCTYIYIYMHMTSSIWPILNQGFDSLDLETCDSDCALSLRQLRGQQHEAQVAQHGEGRGEINGDHRHSMDGFWENRNPKPWFPYEKTYIAGLTQHKWRGQAKKHATNHLWPSHDHCEWEKHIAIDVSNVGKTMP